MANSGKNKRKTDMKKTATRKKANNNSDGVSIYFEVAIILVFLVCILVFISLFGIGGKVGDVVSRVMFGIFGILAFLVPVYVSIAIPFFIVNKRNAVAIVKLIMALVLLILLCGFVGLVYHGDEVVSPVSGYRIGYGMKQGGGWLGVLVCNGLVPNLGIVGAYLVDIAGIIISVILLTERSFFTMFYKPTGKTGNHKAVRREREVKADTAPRRKRAVGVAFDTKIVAPTDKSDEMSELHSEEPIIKPMQVQEPIVKQMQVQEPPQPEQETKVPEPEVKKPIRRKKEEVTRPEQELPVMETSTEMTTDTSGNYKFPPIELLKKGSVKQSGDGDAYLKQTAMKLEQTLRNFGVNVTVTEVNCGPSVTRFELQPEQGVKVSKIVGLSDDIKLNLAAPDIRIEAPIPGKAAVGIEVPNKENVTVMLRDLLESREFREIKSKIPFSAGKDIGGNVVVSDIGKMPHVLIAGATGSGKSVCINTIVMSILYKAKPEEVKLIMIDPKVVELSIYNGIPHLMTPVVTDPKKAAGALNWAVEEMTKRYNQFAESHVRDIKGYNDHVLQYNKEHPDTKLAKMPQIVIIVDELADLMMVAPSEVEDAICRLAQLARAAGIHLILATQRPSVNVITGLIKANMPSRVAFAVSSGVDSRTILDMNGAEKLLGKGDMLFYPQGSQKPMRVQGAFVSDEEVSNVVEFLKANHVEDVESKEQAAQMEERLNAMTLTGSTMATTPGAATDDGRDVYFIDAAKLLIEKERGSIGMLQRMFKIGFNRAARIMDQLEEAGIVGPEEGTKPRKILVTMDELEQMMKENDYEV